MNLRRPVALALAASTALALTACTSAEETPVTEDGPVTITVAMPEADWLGVLTQAFHEAYPEVTVELAPLADGGAEAALATADVVAVSDRSLVGAWVDDKLILDVTDIAQYVSAGAVLDFVKDGYGYGVPYAQDPWLLFYNQDLFDKAKAKAPDGAWIWSDFVTAAKSLTSKTTGVTGTVLPSDPVGTAGLAVAQAGDTVDLMSGADYSFLTTAYTRAFTLMTDGSAPAYTAASGAEPKDQSTFLAGKTAMILAPKSFMAQLTDAAFTWGIAPVPQRDKLTAGLDKTPTTVGDSTGLVIPAAIDAAKLDGAKAWLTFMSSESAAILMAGEGAFPAYVTDGVTNAYFGRDGVPEDALSRFAFQVYSTTPLVPIAAKGGAVWSAIAQATGTILTGKSADVAAGVETLSGTIKGIID
jgi:multiple sugar transport system substrate-binding protein